MGRDQLDLIIGDGQAGPITLYLDLPYDSTMQDRRGAVEQYRTRPAVVPTRVQIKSWFESGATAAPRRRWRGMAKMERPRTPGVGYGFPRCNLARRGHRRPVQSLTARCRAGGSKARASRAAAPLGRTPHAWPKEEDT